MIVVGLWLFARSVCFSCEYRQLNQQDIHSGKWRRVSSPLGIDITGRSFFSAAVVARYEFFNW